MKITLKKLLVLVSLAIFMQDIAWANDADILDNTTDGNGKLVKFGYVPDYAQLNGYYVRLSKDTNTEKWALVDISKSEPIDSDNDNENEATIVVSSNGSYVVPAVRIRPPLYTYLNYAFGPSSVKRNGPNVWLCSGSNSDKCNRTPFSIKQRFALTGTWRTFDFVLLATAYQQANFASQLSEIIAKDNLIAKEIATAKSEQRKIENDQRKVEYEQQKSSKAEQQRNAYELREKLGLAFRSSLKIGSESHCGLVVEIKAPIAKIESSIGEKWLKIDQLYPVGTNDCRFLNGIYQQPTL